MPAGSTPEQAKRAWANYKRTMGVTRNKLAKVRAAFEQGKGASMKLTKKKGPAR